ncbi:MAG: hypothetical protein ACXV7F_09745 [Methylomonas sp.]
MTMNIATNRKIGAGEYLKGKLNSNVKHEPIDDKVYATPGTSKNQDQIAGNEYPLLGNFPGNSPCEPFSTHFQP